MFALSLIVTLLGITVLLQSIKVSELEHRIQILEDGKP